MMSFYTLCGMLEYMKSADMNKKGKEVCDTAKSLSIKIQHIDKVTEEVKRGCTRNITKMHMQ